MEEPRYVARINNELARLMDGSKIVATLIEQSGNYFVHYKKIPTGGKSRNLPEFTDVLVPVPSGYPTAAIDMPALPQGSALIPYVAGGSNPQGILRVRDINWQILSYHPYVNGGGPPWDMTKHGFHDYFNQLFTWLHRFVK